VHYIFNGCNDHLFDTQVGNTSIYIASKEGHKPVVELLLGSGANVNTVNQADRTALHAAVDEGHEAIVQMLVDHGADVYKMYVVDEEDFADSGGTGAASSVITTTNSIISPKKSIQNIASGGRIQEILRAKIAMDESQAENAEHDLKVVSIVDGSVLACLFTMSLIFGFKI
jgi:ankyrin repeat protein